MTPFKFGKKKNKEHAGDTFSPSSKGSNNGQHGGYAQNSPQTSQYSSSSSRHRGDPGSTPASTANRQGSQGSLVNANSPQSFPHHQQYNASYRASQLPATVGYDHNNNMFNQKSPQRQAQYGYPTPQTSSGSSSIPPPRFQQPQQQHQAKNNTPWSRSKLLISPFPRYRHAASQFANDKGEIFVMGGLHNTSVYGDTWIIKPSDDGRGFQTVQVDIYDNSPAPRVGHAATTCGNAFVVFGGDTVTNDEGEIDNDLYLFNMNSHTWTIPHPVGRKPSGRYGHSIGVIAITNFDSKIYLYGGQLDDTIYSDLAVFNLSSFRRPDVAWEWVTPADSVRPPPLTNHTMDVYDNKLWIFGGSTGNSLSNELWSYDPQTNKWDKHKTYGALPAPREEHASVVYKDCLIVYGGKDSYGEALADVCLLNLITKTWFKLPANFPGHPLGKYGHSISLLKDNKLLILGGHLPDYAQLGDNLEPSMEDHGVGTLLNTLDLSNLEKLVPGFQQYSTPGNLRDQERFQGPQSIFTPPQTDERSPPEKKTTSPDPNVGSAIVGGSPAAAPSTSSFNSKQDEVPRVMSAEDVFQRERQVEEQSRKTPQKGLSRQQSIPPLRTPSARRQIPQEQKMYSSPDAEEDLPLQLPSPVISSEKNVPAPLPKDEDIIPQQQQQKEVTDTMPGAFQPVEDFQTPNSSPSKDALYTSVTSTAAPALTQPYSGNQNRDSDFLDSYVNGNSTPDLSTDSGEKDLPPAPVSSGSTIGSTSAGVTLGGTSAAVTAAAALANATRRGSASKKSGEFPREKQSPIGTTGIARSVSINRNVSSVSPDEKAEFKNIIATLSRELENLKVSTNEQIKSASSKVKSLEQENETLKQHLAESQTATRELPEVEDESDIKRKHIKLNTDYHLLNQEHTSLKAKNAELESVFTSNLIDLQKLNNVIKEQGVLLEQQQKEIAEMKTLKTEYEQLKFRYDNLEKEHEQARDLRSASFLESQSDVKQLTAGLDNFLAQYLVKDETTGEVTTRSLGGSSGSSEVTAQLQQQIDELLKENEEAHASNKELELQLESLKSTQSEVETLKAKLAEMSKIEENYKESLHSVRTATRALQISQTDLAKEKELTTKLQHEIDELKLFRVKKSSRNATPVIAQQDDTRNVDEDDDDDVANAHYNLKIRDLQAELYIIKKERDDLKEEVMALKKKLYNADNPSGSF